MDQATFVRLNAINHAFYARTADQFAETRAQGWRGWARLLPLLPTRDRLTILDVGCGNGRLAVYLARALQRPVVYHGIDSNPRLLELADAAIAAARADGALIDAALTQRDILTDPLPREHYDLVGAFGVLHHVPGAARRLAFVRAVAERTAPGGVAAVALWKFYEFERFRAHVIPWTALEDDPIAVEPGDYLLDWRRGERALRYCHFVDAEEERRLIDAAGLPLAAHYRSDGEGGQVNAYLVWRRDADQGNCEEFM